MDPKNTRIVVVGAGQAGASLVARLRALGHAGPVTLVGEEPVPPYQRPPLSKAYLKGELSVERLFLRPESFYDEQSIALRLASRVTAIDREGRRVLLEGGGALDYDLLALTTGARPRLLPTGAGLPSGSVNVLRNIRDADLLAARLSERMERALIVGGGYIGLEVAAVLRGKGLDVRVVEAAPRLLARVAAPATADFFRDLHRRHGVEILEGRSLVSLCAAAGDGVDALLDDGTGFAAGIVLAGIGAVPNTELAAQAGLAIDNGIAVDACGQTSDARIFAAGDCASFPQGSERIRLESVPHAIDHAEAVAASMLGGGEPYAARPWFWSDQYDVKLQIAGLNAGFDRTLTRPGARPGSQSVWYFREGRLVAVDAMNDPRAYMTGKRWIEAGVTPDPEPLSDPMADLRALA